MENAERYKNMAMAIKIEILFLGLALWILDYVYKGIGRLISALDGAYLNKVSSSRKEVTRDFLKQDEVPQI